MKSVRFPFARYGSSQRMWGLLKSTVKTLLNGGGSSPRMWGLLVLVLAHGFFYLGSSPRMWGLLSDVLYLYITLPVHPHVCGVYVIATQSIDDLYTVHPHVCGVYDVPPLRRERIRGSSPRMWGLRFASSSSICSVTGSSPRMWGLLLLFQQIDPNHVRFIPTYVGSTMKLFTYYRVVFRFIPTYVGSTKIDFSVIQKSLTGSSPRMWGLLGC